MRKVTSEEVYWSLRKWSTLSRLGIERLLHPRDPPVPLHDIQSMQWEYMTIRFNSSMLPRMIIPVSIVYFSDRTENL